MRDYRIDGCFFLDEFLSEISVHDLLAKVSRSLRMSKRNNTPYLEVIKYNNEFFRCNLN